MKNICPPCCSPWTPERTARALRLYLHEGFTAAEVADLLGGVSRAAVTAKVRRMGLHKRCRAERAKSVIGSGRAGLPQALIDRRLPPRRPPIPLPPLREVAPTGVPRRLTCLPDAACRWPIDDPGAGRMHLALFCGGAADHGSYCQAHATLAARPPRSAAQDAASS